MEESDYAVIIERYGDFRGAAFIDLVIGLIDDTDYKEPIAIIRRYSETTEMTDILNEAKRIALLELDENGDVLRYDEVYKLEIR